MNTQIPDTQPRWCILRCSSSKTLELAASLSEDGFEAWTPAEVVTRRSRQGNKPEPVRLPLMPGWVFAKVSRMTDLLALSHNPTLNYQVWDSEKRRMVTRGHASFRLLKSLAGFGEVAVIPDRHLNELRKIERSTMPKTVTQAIEVGTRVRLAEAGFEGLNGTVLKSRKSYTTVLIDDWVVPIDVPTWAVQMGLDERQVVNVSTDPSEQALSAKAA